MVLILSDEFYISTQEVIDWLIYYKLEFVRINSNSKILINNIIISNEKVDFEVLIFDSFRKRKFSFSDIIFYWYRKGEFVINADLVNLTNLSVKTSVYNYLKYEYRNINGFMQLLLESIPHLNSIYQNETNKLFNLVIARKVGLRIPYSIIINSSERHLKQTLKNKLLITKSIKHGFYKLNISNCAIHSFTNELDFLDIQGKFSYSLIQENIIKKYYSRIFYFS